MQESKLRAAIRSQFPKISIGTTMNKDTDGLKTEGIGINMEFPFFDRNQGVIAKERATRKMLFDEYKARIFEAKSDIASIVTSIHAIQKKISYSNKLIQKKKTTSDGYSDVVNNGQAGLLSYYNALVTLYYEELKRLNLEQQMVDLGIALEISSGQLGLIN